MASTTNLGIIQIEQAQAQKESTLAAAFTLIDDALFVRSGTFAARPAASKAGRIYRPTDGFLLYRDTGTAWESFGPIYPLIDPNLQTWSWQNQGTASVSTTNGGIYLKDTAAGAGQQLRIREMTAPATPWQVTALWCPQVAHKTGIKSGICFRNSTGLQIATAHFSDNDLHVGKFTSPTVFSADYLTIPVVEWNDLWVRIRDDGTNRITSLSRDGQNFTIVHTIARLDFITVGADRVGFFVDASNAATPNIDGSMTLLSWAVG